MTCIITRIGYGVHTVVHRCLDRILVYVSLKFCSLRTAINVPWWMRASACHMDDGRGGRCQS
jgi:hypothetical protein